MKLFIIILIFLSALTVRAGLERQNDRQKEFRQVYERTVRSVGERRDRDRKEKDRNDKIQRVADLFRNYKSPMLGTEDKLVDIAAGHNLDYRLIVGLAFRESTLGRNACGYNAFGIGRCNIKFSSWEEGYRYLGKLLTTSNYYAKWRQTGRLPDLIKVYCPDCNANKYAYEVEQFTKDL